MMIPKEFVTEKSHQILEERGETELKFLSSAVPAFVKDLLTKAPDFWKNFGMYWWNLMAVMENYAPREFRQYAQMVGGQEQFGRDDEIRREYDYGTDMFNWVAAMLYLEFRIESYQLGADNPHYVTDEYGNERAYIPSVGFVNEEDTDEGETPNAE